MIKNCRFLTFKVNFPRQKLSESFSIFFSLKNINLGTHFLLLTFLENKVLWKLKLSKNVNNKKCAPKLIFLNEKKLRKIRIIFDVENWRWKSEFLQFLTTFTQLSARPKNFLMEWLLVAGLKECLLECATIRVKSVVILSA